MTVNVKLYYPEETIDQRDIDGHVAQAHAKLGYPVTVRIGRGNNTHVVHLSMSDAAELHAGLGPLVHHGM